MATHLLSQIARKIVALVDGQVFFEHWQERFREPTKLGTTVKAHCPFHLGESFRSLLLDLRKNTFRCTVTQCKAAAGGSFIDLHGLLTGKPPLETLLDFCLQFNVDLPEEIHLELGSALADHARKLLQEKKPELAENYAALALKENPTNSAIRLLLAEICEQRERPADARPHYESILEEAIEEKDWSRASSILERLLAAAPDTPTYVQQAAMIAEARGNRSDAAGHYLDLAKRAETSPEQKRQWLEKALELDPARADVLEPLGALYEEAGEIDKAVGVWESLARQLRLAGRAEESIDVLDRIARVQPERSDLQEQRAEILLASDRPQEAAGILRTLADHAREQNAPDRAEHYLRRLCESVPEDLESHWQLMTLLEEAGRLNDAMLIADQLLAGGDPESPDDRYIQTLERLIRWDPTNAIHRERLADGYMKQGNTDAALGELRQLAELCFQRDLRADALHRVQAMKALLADEPRRQLDLAQLLAANGCAQEAAAQYEEIARACLADDPALAEEACRGGLTADNTRPLLHETLLEVLLRDRPDAALAHAHEVVELYRSQGNVGRAIAILDHVKEHLPGLAEPSLLLAGVAAEIGESDRAVQELQEIAALELSPEQTGAAVSLANALAERQSQRIDLLQALAELHRRQDNLDAVVEVQLRLAAVQRSQASAEAAEATYLEIFAIRPNEPRALYGHAELVRTERGFPAARALYQRYVAQLLSAGRGEEAVRTYLKCIEWAPEDVDCRRALGALLAEEGDIDGARRHWEAAAKTYLTVHENVAAAAECYEAILTRYPDDIETRKGLARLHAKLGSESASIDTFCQTAERQAAVGDLEGQVDTVRAALEIFPGNVMLTRRLADALCAAGRQEEGVAVGEGLLQAQEQEGASEEARETLRQLLEMAPERTHLRERLAAMLLEVEDTAGAAEQYRLTAQQHLGEGQHDLAVAARQKVKEFDPADIANRRALVDLYRSLKNKDALRDELDELASALRESGKAQLALEIMEERLQVDPDDLDHCVALAEMRSKAGQTEAAAEEFCRLGELFQERNDEERARQMLERALQLRPGDNKFRRRLVKVSLREADPARAAAELNNLAEAFFNTGERDEALDCCKQMLKLGRKNPDIQADVAKIYARHDMTDEARDTYDRAIQRCQKDRDTAKALSVIERALEDFPQAEDLWQKRVALARELELYEKAAGAVVGLTALMRRQGRHASQIEPVFREAAEMADSSLELLEAMADFYIDEDRIDQAANALRGLAGFHEARGDREKAIAALNRLCSFRPADEDALSALTRLQKEVGEEEAARESTLRLVAQHKTRGQWQEARALLEPLLEEDGPDEQIMPILIEACREMGDREAETRFAQTWTTYLEERGRADEAANAYEKAIEHAPTDWDAYQRLIDLHQRRGNGEGQVAALAKLAKACEKAEETDRALAARLQLRTLDPENIENLLALGDTYRRHERADQALATLQEAFDLLVRDGKSAAAVGVGEAVLALDEARDAVREKLVDLLVELEETKKAAGHLSRLAAKQVESDSERAVATYRRVLQYQSGRAADRQALAGLLSEAGERDTAIAEYIQAAQDFAKAQHPASGVACLEAVLALEPNHRMANELVVQLRQAAGAPAMAATEAVAVADRALAEGRIEDAERILTQAAEAGTEEAQLACDRLIDLYVRNSRLEEALNLLGPLVEKARRDHDQNKLAAYLENICDIVPIDHEHRIELVEISLERHDLRKALEHFRKLLPSLMKLGLMGEGDHVGQLILAHAGDEWETKEEVARTYAQAQLNDLAAMTYLDMASSARGLADHERVLDYATSALGLDPENVAAHEMLLEANLTLNHAGEAFRHADVLSLQYDDQDLPEKAIAVTRKMIELFPENPMPHERLSELLEKQGAENELCDVLERLADLYIRNEDTQQAIDTLSRYLVMRPDAVDMRKRYVELAASQGQEAELVDDFAVLIAAAIDTGDSEEADRLFQRALELDPLDVEMRERWVEFLYNQEREAEGHESLIALTEILAKQGKSKKAAKLVAEATQRFPNAAILHACQGDLELAVKAKGQAIESFRKAAQLFKDAGEVTAANAAAEKILQIDPLDVTTRSNLVDSLLSEEQIEPALEHGRVLAAHYAERNLLDLAEREYRRIVLHKPDDLRVWQSILDIIERMGEQSEHVADYLLVAELLADRGVLDQAAQLYRQAIQHDPENIEPRRAFIDLHLQFGDERELVPDYLELADLLASRGLTEDAVQYYQRVTKIEPDNAHARLRLNHLRPDISEEKTVVVGSKEHQEAMAKKAREATHPPAPGSNEEKTLREQLQNRREILEAKPDNPLIRSQVGDLLFRLGEVDQALEEWDRASAQFFQQKQMVQAIRLCEKILELDPSRSAVQARFKQANLQKDSMAAIESLIESFEREDFEFGEDSPVP